MSRGMLIRMTSAVTGSMLATRSVSVRAVDRDSAESTPVSRTLMRDCRFAGVAMGATLNSWSGVVDWPGARDGAGVPSGDVSPTKIFSLAL